jgi:hypothetical protein
MIKPKFQKMKLSFRGKGNKALILLIIAAIIAVTLGLAPVTADSQSLILVILGAIGGVPALFEIGDRIVKNLERFDQQWLRLEETEALKQMVADATRQLEEERERVEILRKAIALEVETLRGVTYNATSDAQAARNDAQAAREIALRAESNLVLQLVERLVKLEDKAQV